MKRSVLWLLLVTLATAGSFLILVFYSLNNMSPRLIPVESAEGKQVWEKHSCIECHSIMGNGGYSAPDLTNVISERGDKWLEQFFLDPPVIRPSEKKRHMKLDHGETQKIIEYLGFVDQIKNNHWPSSSKLIFNKTQKQGE